jgi:hypothetical protein
MRYLFFALLLACDAAPAECESWDMSLKGEPTDNAHILDFSVPSDTEFLELCVDPPGALALQDTLEPLAIVAVQTDGCIEPRDGVFDDLVLWSGVPWRLYRPRDGTTDRAVFRLRFACATPTDTLSRFSE